MLTKRTEIAPMSEYELNIVRGIESQMAEMEQISIHTHHLIHGGNYLRTINLQAGAIITGVVIKIPTTIILNGNINILVGSEVKNYNGFHILPASAGRKQLMTALQDTSVTMIFPTQAKTVEEAEKEFTDEFDLLMSNEADNTITITGE